MIQFKKKFKIELAPTLQGHWYSVHSISPKYTKPLGYFPSSTTILNAYPQSQHLTKWIADQGWNESQKIKSEAGERGTKVHAAVEDLLNGLELSTLAYSLEEWFKIKTFVDWYKEVRPEVMATEIALFSPKYKYAGRVDCVARIDGKITVIDWKTGGSMYPHYPLQYASYAQAIEETTDIKVEQTAGLQLGTKSKLGYKFDVHKDWHEDLEVFNHVRATWDYDNYGSRKNPKEPPILILPPILSLK